MMKFIKISFRNLCNDGVESSVFVVDDEAIESGKKLYFSYDEILDEYLCNTCYCDDYEFEIASGLNAEQSEKYRNFSHRLSKY